MSGIDDVESPTRAFLLDGNGGSVEVTQPGVTGWAFDPADLIP